MRSTTSNEGRQQSVIFVLSDRRMNTIYKEFMLNLVLSMRRNPHTKSTVFIRHRWRCGIGRGLHTPVALTTKRPFTA